MIIVTKTYLQIENGTFNPPKSKKITEEERERIKAKYPNAYKSAELGLDSNGETDWVVVEPRFIK